MPFCDLAPEKDVGGGRQVVAEREILVHDLDAVLARLDRPVHHEVARPPSASFHASGGNCRR